MQISPIDINIFKVSSINQPFKSIQELKEKSADEQKQIFENKKQLTKIFDQIPIIKLVEAEYKVVGENTITPGAYVTLEIKFKPLFKLSNDMEFKESKWWDSNADRVHSPFVDKNVLFVAGLANGDRLITATRVWGFKGQTCKLQFISPEVGKWAFKGFILCDSFRGIDLEFDLVLNVVKLEEVESEVESVETESSSSDDSVVVAKTARKRRYVKKSERGPYDDSSDSSDVHSSDED